jgi:hypothetical protein
VSTPAISPARLVALCVVPIACTLPPSPLGELPGDDTSGGPSSTSDAETTTPTTSTTEAPTTGIDPTTGEPATTGELPQSAWGEYCEYINSHGGRCDPTVDTFPDLAYPGRGFVVHEWGTDTVVVGSDGAQLRGLHHEEEELPTFVYDRISAGSLPGGVSAHVKMETPVTYFYSETPRSVAVTVDFPAGVFTQWYPAVAAFLPKIAAPESIPKLFEFRDPVMDPSFPFAQDMCRPLYMVIAGGRLDWGSIEVLARDADEPLPDAPIDQYMWGHAREVDANLLRISGVPGAEQPQHERFLFYRGLGNFALPVVLTAAPGGKIAIDNTSAMPVGRLFVLNVSADSGAFVEWPEGVAPGQMLADDAPSLASAPPLDLFAEALGERVTEALDGAGLYHDEALAMVATWKRQWFRSPGLRVLYLVPQAWTDTSIPLGVTPAPDASVRVMLIRGEVTTPEQEQLDVAAAELLADVETEATGRAHFLALGRFAEPRLRRAAALLGDPPYVEALIAELLHADTRVALGE